MKTLSQPRRAALILPLLALLLVSGCEGQGTPPQTFPPSADVEAVTAAKPKPTPDIVTDPQANERYNAAVESWGDRLHDAGVRLCTYLKSMGAPYTFDCQRQ